MYSLLTDAPSYESSNEHDSSTNSLHINSLHNRFYSHYTRPASIPGTYWKQEAILYGKHKFDLQHSMEIMRSTLQFAQTSPSACTPLTHTLTHTLLLGRASRGGGIPSSLAYWNPPFLSLSLPLSLSVATFIYVFQSRVNPPLQTPFPVEDHYLTSRYFIPPSLSLPLLHFLSYPLHAFSPLSLVLISTAHRSLSSLSFHLVSILILCCSHPEKQSCST